MKRQCPHCGRYFRPSNWSKHNCPADPIFLSQVRECWLAQGRTKFWSLAEYNRQRAENWPSNSLIYQQYSEWDQFRRIVAPESEPACGSNKWSELNSADIRDVIANVIRSDVDFTGVPVIDRGDYLVRDRAGHVWIERRYEVR